jgi:hypothetical protein
VDKSRQHACHHSWATSWSINPIIWRNNQTALFAAVQIYSRTMFQSRLDEYTMAYDPMVQLFHRLNQHRRNSSLHLRCKHGILPKPPLYCFPKYRTRTRSVRSRASKDPDGCYSRSGGEWNIYKMRNNARNGTKRDGVL